MKFNFIIDLLNMNKTTINMNKTTINKTTIEPEDTGEYDSPYDGIGIPEFSFYGKYRHIVGILCVIAVLLLVCCMLRTLDRVCPKRVRERNQIGPNVPRGGDSDSSFYHYGDGGGGGGGGDGGD